SDKTTSLTQDSGSGGGSENGDTKSRAGVGISGSVAVNVVNDTAAALINADGVMIGVNDGDATLTATNDTPVLALSGAGALAANKNAKANVGIAGALGMNLLGGQTRVEVMQADELDVGNGDLSVSARRKGIGI